MSAGKSDRGVWVTLTERCMQDLERNEEAEDSKAYCNGRVCRRNVTLPRMQGGNILEKRLVKFCLVIMMLTTRHHTG